MTSPVGTTPDKTSRIAVIGSRFNRNSGATWELRSRAQEAVRAFVQQLPAGSEVVSGGADGVDLWAEIEARRRPDLPEPRIFPVEKPHRKLHRWEFAVLAKERNQKIVDHADVVYAFHDGKSRGTADTIARARAANKLSDIFLITEEIE